jgi:TetR/AcrR family transcriptional repressor of nem operon
MGTRRSGRGRGRRRGAEATRAQLLAAGFEEVYRHGFQGASIDRILGRVRVTRGAFFYYFPTKLHVGYALIEETITGMIRAQWVEPLAAARDPLKAIGDGFEAGVRVLEAMPVNLGCPLNNLAQEMSPLHRGFRRRTQAVFALWISAFARALRRGQRTGQVRKSVDARAAAFALVAEIEGILSLAKNSQDRRALRLGVRHLRTTLATLRVGRRAR